MPELPPSPCQKAWSIFISAISLLPSPFPLYHVLPARLRICSLLFSLEPLLPLRYYSCFLEGPCLPWPLVSVTPSAGALCFWLDAQARVGP